MRALHYAIRPAELHHQALAILEIVEVEDCFLECFEAACHVLIMADLASDSKYIIALSCVWQRLVSEPVPSVAASVGYPETSHRTGWPRGRAMRSSSVVW